MSHMNAPECRWALRRRAGGRLCGVGPCPRGPGLVLARRQTRALAPRSSRPDAGELLEDRESGCPIQVHAVQGRPPGEEARVSMALLRVWWGLRARLGCSVHETVHGIHRHKRKGPRI